MILGVNDIINSERSSDQILADLTTILGALKAHNPAVKTILFTIPTFNFALAPYTTWKTVNDTILATPPPGADRVFDVAAVESQPRAQRRQAHHGLLVRATVTRTTSAAPRSPTRSSPGTRSTP